jgi:hypothetical protein
MLRPFTDKPAARLIFQVAPPEENGKFTFATQETLARGA